MALVIVVGRAVEGWALRCLLQSLTALGALEVGEPLLGRRAFGVSLTHNRSLRLRRLPRPLRQ